MEAKFGCDLANVHFDFSSQESVSCILCDEQFVITFDTQPLLKHLLEVHQLVIGAPEEISDFRHYIIYWKKLQSTNLKDYCIIFQSNTELKAVKPSEEFYLLCEKLPEDKCLRTTLRKMKLNFITHQKEEECRHKDFSRVCIYCPSIIDGGLANSFHHLTFDHGFSLGNPDNIVFGEKLLDIMDNMLQRLQCLNCEKTFRNHSTLREHMRKKQHRSLNPKNKHYDQFYLLNYLKPGTPWEEAKKKIFEEEETKSGREREAEIKEGEDCMDEDQLWTDWREDAAGIHAVCLFCPFTTTKIRPTLFHHMEENHHFPFETLTEHLNFYSKVKLINFIRTQVSHFKCFFCNAEFTSSDHLVQHSEACSYLHLPLNQAWDKPVYLIPVFESDGLLIHLDDNDIEDENTSSVASSLDEDVVLPEDSVSSSLPSILSDKKLRQELSEEDMSPMKDCLLKVRCSAVFKCFFCSFASNGHRGKGACIIHMNHMHNFSLKENIEKLERGTRNNIINYLRAMTELGKCFVCGKCYVTKGGLEEHRILEGHTNLPPLTHPYYESWERSLINDGFQTDEEHRVNS